MLGRELQGVGIREVERQNERGNLAQRLEHRTAGHERRTMGSGVEELLDAPGVHAPRGGVHRDILALSQTRACTFRVEQRRHAELASDVGQMSGDTALLRHQRGRARQKRRPARQGHGSDQHRALGKTQGVDVPPGDEDRPGPGPGGGCGPAGEQLARALDGPAGRRAGRRRPRQRPTLQQQHPATTVHHPFDVLRAAIGVLQQNGQPRQLEDLGVRQRRGVHEFRLHVLAAQALALVGHDAAGLGADRALAQNERDRASRRRARRHVEIRGRAAVHHLRGQAPHGVDAHGVVAGIEGIARVHDPAGAGVGKAHAAHAHGHVLVANAPAEPVGDGVGRMLAGHDFLVGVEQTRGRDVEQAAELPGEGRAGGVLAKGAAAHGDAEGSAVGPGRQAPVGLADGVGQGLRHGRGHDARLNVRADAEALGRRLGSAAVLGQGLQPGVDLGLQIAPGHEGLEARGRDDEAVRHGQAQARAHVGQVGHLAAGEVRRMAVHLIEAQNKGAVPARGAAGEDVVHPGLDVGQAGVKGVEAAGLQLREGAHQLEHVHAHGRGPRAHEAHAEDARAFESLFQVAHDFERLVVGLQQPGECLGSRREQRPQLLLAGRGSGGAAGEGPHDPAEKAWSVAHVTSIAEIFA